MSLSIAVSQPITRLQSVPHTEWAKHRYQATKDLRRLLLSWCMTGKWHYPFLLLSRTGYLLARDKYSAFSIDRVYANTPEGWGWIGRRVDRYLLDLPVHRAVRARFEFVVGNGTEIVEQLLAQRADRLAVLSVPCGLVRDLCTIYARLRLGHPDIAERLVLYGLDVDFEGNVLEEAQRRARQAGVPIHLIQANALHPRSWSWLSGQEPSFSLINCIGLAPWLKPWELRSLLERFADHLHPGGYVLIDRWNHGKHGKWGKGADIHANYHTREEYREHIQMCGFTLLKSEILGEDEGMGYVLQKPVVP